MFRISWLDGRGNPERVRVQNVSDSVQDAGNWQLYSVREERRFTLPAITQVASGKEITIVAGAAAGRGDPLTFIWSDAPVFDDGDDGVQLLNRNGEVVDAVAYLAGRAPEYHAVATPPVPFPAPRPDDPLAIHVIVDIFGPVDPLQYVDRAPVTVIGEVIGAGPARFNTPDGARPPDLRIGVNADPHAHPEQLIVTSYTIRVIDGIRGAQPGDTLTIWQPGGRVGRDSLTYSIPGGLKGVGQRVLLFARPFPNTALPDVWSPVLVGEIDDRGMVYTFQQVTPLDAIRAAIAASSRAAP